MQILLTILIFVLIFSLLILIHEFGHFMAAKKSGVKVEEFGMGLPPRIFGVKRGETLYSLNWIPFGGFVRMEGEDGKSKKSKTSFESKTPATQLFIVSAGVIMNFLLAFVLLTIGFLIGIEPLIATQDDFLEAVKEEQVILSPQADFTDESISLPRLIYIENSESIFSGILENRDSILKVDDSQILSEQDFYSALTGKTQAEVEFYDSSEQTVKNISLPLQAQSPIITFVFADSPAQMAGLEFGDKILKIGGKDVSLSTQVVTFNKETQTEQNTVLYELDRAGEILQKEISLDENNRVGVMLSDSLNYYGNLSLYNGAVPNLVEEIVPAKYSLLKAPIVAIEEMYRLGKMTAIMFFDVFKKFLFAEEVPDGVAGPVGIAQMTFSAVQDGLGSVIRFVALLSLSLGVINFLPIPALDGGRAVFILYRGFTGKSPNGRIEHFIHLAGFFLLLIFIAYVTFNDVMGLL